MSHPGRLRWRSCLLLLVAGLPALAGAQGQPSDDDLSKAFAPEVPAAPPPEPPSPAAPVEIQDPLAEERSVFSRRISETPADLPAWVKELDVLAERLGPAAQQQLFATAARLALAHQDDRGADRWARKWLLSCGPTTDDCRSTALTALESAGPAGRKDAAKLKSADECVDEAEGALHEKTPLPKCLGAVEKVYAASRDRWMSARVLLAQGRGAVLEQSRRAFALLERAAKACPERRCLEVRHQALEALVDLHLVAGSADAAVRTALSEVKLLEAEAPEAARHYQWTQSLGLACAALDKKKGPGSCRKAQKHDLKHYVFKDFSQNGGAELSPEQVKAVNEHFAVLLEECIAFESERLQPSDSASYGVRWVVRNDGRADQVHLVQKVQDSGPLASCLRSQFSLFRYPRYQGELQHVEQNFVVRARVR